MTSEARSAYIDTGFLSVNGMTSGIAMQVMGEVLSQQEEWDIRGPLVEIGSFEGRTFILLAMSSRGDIVLTIDSFRHPDDFQIERFRAALDRFNIDRSNVIELRGLSRNVSTSLLKERLKSDARFFHIDGGHRYHDVMHDLLICYQCFKEDGVLCLDDLLHPFYPGLTLAVHDFLRATPSLRVFAVVDRESIVAASKYLVCNVKYFDQYRSLIETKFGGKILSTRADFMGYQTPIVAAV